MSSTIARCRSHWNGGQLRPLRAEGEERRELDARPLVGKQRSFALELLHRAPQVRRHARRRRGNVEGRRTRTREQINKLCVRAVKRRTRGAQGENNMSLNRVTLIGHL